MITVYVAFDLSDFDALTNTVAEEQPMLNNDADALAFSTPEIPETVLETPELSTPAVDFDLPDELADVEQLTASLDDLETSGDDFADFDIADNEAGFVSGAVGTGETLEAKLELAKMYIEIEDMDTARDMLNELLADSDSEISAQAKVLLAQIG